MMFGSLLSILCDQPCGECRQMFAVAALTPIIEVDPRSAPDGILAGFLCPSCKSSRGSEEV